MIKIRKEVVAGMFYPDQKDILGKTVNSHMNFDESIEFNSEPLGFIVPHAGYYYSGNCAAYSFQAMKKKQAKTIIIVAPSHKFNNFDFSVGDYDFYQTPMGRYPVNKKLTAELLEKKNFVFYPEAHNQEHSVEVQIPFLQYVKPDCKIVPILFGQQNYENSLILADTIYEIIKDKPEDFIILISSDLSHYHNINKAKAMDNLLMENIKNLDLEKIKEDYFQQRIEACGIGGIFMMLNLAKKMNLEVEHLNYMTSGDISGEERQVVGYLSSVFYQGEQ